MNPQRSRSARSIATRVPWRASVAALILGALAPSALTAARVHGPDPTAQASGSRSTTARVPPAVDPFLLDAFHDLLSPPLDGPAPDLDQLNRSLLALGPQAVPIFCGVLCGEVSATRESTVAHRRSIHPRLAAEIQPLLRNCLRACEPTEVIAHLAERAAPGAPLEVQLASASLLGDLQGARALDLLFQLLGDVEPAHLEWARVSAVFEESIARHLTRCGPTDPVVDALVRRATIPQCMVLAHAATRVSSGHAARLFRLMLGRDRDLDRTVVHEIARIAMQRRLQLDEPALATLRTMLRSSDLEDRRLSGSALAALGDIESFETIVWQLQSPDVLERGTARRSLVTLSGVDLGPQAKDWINWFQQESTWWNESGPQELERLASSDAHQVQRSISALVRHPLRRAEIVEGLGPLAVHSDATVAAGACRALSKLGCRSALPWLVEGLTVESGAVREQSAAALHELTGLTHGADYLAWSRALGIQ